MTKNKKNKQTEAPLSDEFEKMLDSFINEHSEMLREDEERKWPATFRYDGKEYRSPDIYKGTFLPIRSMEAELAGITGDPVAGTLRLFTDRKLERKLRINLSIGHWDDDDLRTVHATLYRKGRPEPLATGSITEEGDVVYRLDLDSEEDLRPGSYFICLRNACPDTAWESWETLADGLICQNLLVRPDGIRLKRPELTGCSTLWNSAGTNGLWRTDPLNLQVRLSGGVTEDAELHALCYDADLSLQATGTCPIGTKDRNDCKKTLALSGTSPWQPGKYTVMITLNRFPFGKIGLEIREDGSVSRQLQAMDKHDLYFRMVRKMEFGKYPNWHLTRQLSGLGMEKKKFIELFEAWEKEEAQGGGRFEETVVITAPDPFWANRTAFSVKRELKIGRKGAHTVNCRDAHSIQQASILQLTEDREDRAFVVMHADRITHPSNKEILDAVLSSATHPYDGVTLALCFTDRGYEGFSRLYPNVAACVEESHHIRLKKQTPRECIRDLWKVLDNSHLVFGPDTRAEIAETVYGCWHMYDLEDWTDYGEWIKAVMEAVCIRLNLRTYRADDPKEVESGDLMLEEYLRQRAGTTRVEQEENDRTQRFEEAMRDLNALVGLDQLKKGMVDLCVKEQFNRQREKLGLPTDRETPMHLIFTGNPGTSKTTVAKLLGKIYHSLGLLSNGEVVVTERMKLVGAYIGQTEENMRRTLEEAKGKVLFIDEAYNLCDAKDDRKDFGNRVVESLLTLLAEPHSDRVVVLAGYKKEMDRLLEMNAGLKSRFAFHYDFADYTADELYRIATDYLGNYRYKLTEDASTALRTVIENRVANKEKEFGNARWVKQLFDHGVLPAMARRVMGSGQPGSMELFTRIEAADIRAVDDGLVYGDRKESRRVGFR